MGLRRDGRETAVQFLFSKDIKNDTHSEDLEFLFNIHGKRRQKICSRIGKWNNRKDRKN